MDDFVYWYNDVRFHESPDTKHCLQTPKDAFWSSLPVEAGSGVAFKLLMRWGMRGRFISQKFQDYTYSYHGCHSIRSRGTIEAWVQKSTPIMVVTQPLRSKAETVIRKKSTLIIVVVT